VVLGVSEDMFGSRLRRSPRRGVTLIDTLLGLFLIGVVGIVFSATFPSSIKCYGGARNYKMASAVAQKKLEEVRSMNFESLTDSLINSTRLADLTGTSGVYSFTSTDSVTSILPEGTGTITITSPRTDIKRVEITVNWKNRNSASTRSLRLVTYVSDKRPRGIAT
jgi:hypothetical protein